jgi:hypothetical protein
MKLFLGALPPRCGLVMALTHLQGLTHSEAAERLGISEKAVEKQVRRGRDRLRKWLEHKEDGSVSWQSRNSWGGKEGFGGSIWAQRLVGLENADHVSPTHRCRQRQRPRDSDPTHSRVRLGMGRNVRRPDARLRWWALLLPLLSFLAKEGSGQVVAMLPDTIPDYRRRIGSSPADGRASMRGLRRLGV